MKLTAYRLYFTGPLHISDARSDYGSGEMLIHSDGFYAALIASLAKLGETVSADLGCTISSLFPFTSKSDNQEIVYFFPKPLLDLKSFTDYSDIKKLKRVEWLDQSYFQELLSGKIGKPIDEATIKESYLTETKIDAGFIKRQVVPRVAVPRSAEENGGDTNIFYIEKTYFSKDSGLYFLHIGETNLLEKALNLLQYEGIGTDRNVGFGSFSFVKDENFELQLPTSTQHSVSLSLFNSEQSFDLSAAASDKNSAWDIVKRGGWVSTEGNIGIRKKSVYMMREGSIFYDPDQTLSAAGKVNIDLKPEDTEDFIPPSYPVWRCGRSIFLPIKIIE